jgi:hypothetical protein
LTGLRANMRLLAEAGNERGRDPRREISQTVSETLFFEAKSAGLGLFRIAA